MRLPIAPTVIAAAALGLAACSALGPNNKPSENPAGPPANVAGFARFTDIPMPPKNSLDLDRTIIFGTDRDWIGRVSLTAPMTVNDVYDFYKSEMPRLGWTELTTVRSATSVLSYQLDNRVATIQLSARRSLIGNSTQVDFWMNPKAGTGVSTFAPSGGFGSSGGAAGGAYSAPSSGGGIQSTPLPPQR